MCKKQLEKKTNISKIAGLQLHLQAWRQEFFAPGCDPTRKRAKRTAEARAPRRCGGMFSRKILKIRLSDAALCAFWRQCILWKQAGSQKANFWILIKPSKLWFSQLWTQFMHLRVEASTKFGISTGFEPLTSRYRCYALTNWAMKPPTLRGGHLNAIFHTQNCGCEIKWAMILALMNAIYAIAYIGKERNFI